MTRTVPPKPKGDLMNPWDEREEQWRKAGGVPGPTGLPVGETAGGWYLLAAIFVPLILVAVVQLLIGV